MRQKKRKSPAKAGPEWSSGRKRPAECCWTCFGSLSSLSRLNYSCNLLLLGKHLGSSRPLENKEIAQLGGFGTLGLLCFLLFLFSMVFLDSPPLPSSFLLRLPLHLLINLYIYILLIALLCFSSALLLFK